MRTRLVLLPLAIAVAGCRRAPSAAPEPAGAPPAYAVIPNPESITVSSRDSFLVTPRTTVYIAQDATAEVEAIGAFAANLISNRADTPPERLAAGSAAPDSSIALSLDAARGDLGAEGYELTSTPTSVRIVAAQPAGLFYGVQTMRQLFPPAIEHQAAYQRRLTMPAAHVVDRPRYEWRGAMLDVARHFLPAADVKRFIDYYALYKINRLHLHLADDQGWRIEIASWPNLTAVGARTQVGGGKGGFYTQAEYADIVAYARSRYITVVPEIDMPGHSTAALASYPDLRCSRIAPEVFTGVSGPPNTLCTTRDSVYDFVRDVVREIVAAAPTPYFHIGGDEVQGLSKEDYHTFVERVEKIVIDAGPRVIGWSEIAPASLSPNDILQHWTKDSSVIHARRGGKVILSPNAHLYIDMKYDSTTSLGLRWAGLIDLRKAYDWNPATELADVAPSSILGLEAPLWAETLITRQDYEYMAFPRITALAELAWSAPNRIGWDGYRRRVAMHGARLAALGVNFARVPGIPWTW
jgi:hexosaminidase